MKNLRIFLVDDDQDDLENISEVIAGLGCAEDLKTFKEPKQLLDFLQTNSFPLPDLIVFDHQMPGFMSTQAIDTLRRDDRFSHTTLAVYSSHLTPKKIEELKAGGVDAANTKGISMQEIEDHISQFCQVAYQKKG